MGKVLMWITIVFSVYAFFIGDSSSAIYSILVALLIVTTAKNNRSRK